MRTDWPRWTSCSARRPWPWLGRRGPASGPAHASSLGHDGHGADVRRPTRPDPTAPGAGDDWRGSDLAVGGGVSGPGSADRADDAAAARRSADAPLRGQSRGAAERAAHPRQQQKCRQSDRGPADPAAEVVALFMDGVVVAPQTAIVVLG